jgi:tetrahydromethanopterin S-methyltransferase subunit G
MAGAIDGINGDHVRLAPSFIVDAADIAAIARRLGDAIEPSIEGPKGHGAKQSIKKTPRRLWAILSPV